MGAELLAHLGLLVTSINTNDLEAHGLGVLNSEGAETSTSTDHGNGLSWASSRLLQALVDSDTCAKDRGNRVKWDVLGYPCNMGSFCDAVFLEGAIDCVPREKSLPTKRLINPFGRSHKTSMTRSATTCPNQCLLHSSGSIMHNVP